MSCLQQTPTGGVVIGIDIGSTTTKAVGVQDGVIVQTVRHALLMLSRLQQVLLEK